MIGTTIFISFGLGSVAQFQFGGNSIGFISVNVSFGFGLSMGIIFAGKISGLGFAFIILINIYLN